MEMDIRDATAERIGELRILKKELFEILDECKGEVITSTEIARTGVKGNEAERTESRGR